jgi:RimJ/RimL family protein N-acetyltransferase
VLALRARPAELVGLVGVAPCTQEEPGTLELGYLLGRAHWGQGFATEAAQAILDAVFLYSRTEAVMASIRVGNAPSRKVLERCGFQYEGSGMRPRPVWGDSNPVDLYRLSRGLWLTLEHFPIKWMPVDRRKCDKNNKIERST